MRVFFFLLFFFSCIYFGLRCEAAVPPPLPANTSSNWYLLNPGVYNYSNYSTIVLAATALGLPIHARDGAVIYSNETVAPISTTLSIIGDLNGLIGAFLTIETSQNPVFVLVNSGELSVRDLQISFNGTLFNTNQNSLLRLSGVNMWIGTIGVSVQNTPGPGVGLIASRLQCMNLATCLLYLTTGAALNCSECRFMNPRNTAVSVSSSTSSAISGLNIIDSVWVNAQFFITVQASPLAVPVQYILPSNWGYLYNNINTRTYAQNCIQPTQSPSPSPVFGGGGGGGSTITCPVCPEPTSIWWNIAYLIIIGLSLVALAAVSMNSVMGNQTTVIRIENKDN